MKKIYLNQTTFAIVDADDFDKVNKHKWYLSGRYAVSGEAKPGMKAYTKMHRFIMGLDNKSHVDHIDGNGLNNQKSNLRFATSAQNRHNAKKRTNTKNNFKGTLFMLDKQAWQSRCRMNGCDYYLGLYTSEIAAAYAYNKQAIKLSSYSRINHLPYPIEYLEELIITTKLIMTPADKHSKYPFVYWNKAKQKWELNYKTNGIKIRGTFKTDKDAYLFYSRKIKEIRQDKIVTPV